MLFLEIWKHSDKLDFGIRGETEASQAAWWWHIDPIRKPEQKQFQLQRQFYFNYNLWTFGQNHVKKKKKIMCLIYRYRLYTLVIFYCSFAEVGGARGIGGVGVGGGWQQPRFTLTQRCKSSPDRTGSSQSWLAAFRSHYVTLRHSSEFMKTRRSGFNYLILCGSPSGSARRWMCATTMQRQLWTHGGKKRKY